MAAFGDTQEKYPGIHVNGNPQPGQKASVSVFDRESMSTAAPQAGAESHPVVLVNALAGLPSDAFPTHPQRPPEMIAPHRL